ncbi:hypothetical protein E6R60_05735 [Streptomyces sp. A0642]|uniref:hypothetical protein n=1 Tax=Streptomyces sp. A0642 TaxID=2563100 RepID=UPI0010A21443|nr:hypothetical protein [Streptomyces sp. A0642]THA78386.1 hypothetical protein E6R60_05735 [Streptomyces sp. A0642]
MPDAIVALALVLVVGAALVLVSTYTRGHRAPTAGPDGDPTGAPPDSGLYLACHSLVCGHLEQLHDVTASGLVCRRCGQAPK